MVCICVCMCICVSIWKTDRDRKTLAFVFISMDMGMYMPQCACGSQRTAFLPFPTFSILFKTGCLCFCLSQAGVLTSYLKVYWSPFDFTQVHWGCRHSNVDGFLGFCKLPGIYKRRFYYRCSLWSWEWGVLFFTNLEMVEVGVPQINVCGLWPGEQVDTSAGYVESGCWWDRG